MKYKPVVVRSVLNGSIAEEAGVEAGDAILSINGQSIRDVFDYRFLIAEEELLLEIEKKEGEVWEVEIEKDEYEDLGVEFESSMMDEAKSCTNKCIFCFIDQLPQGMRETLYFKDDDSRLSFLTGNYVTLTNMSDEDIDRIIKFRMSPINVSVHATNPDLRIFMLKNKFAGDIVKNIKKLVDSGITVNCQIVLCRCVNDGAELDRTISELSSLYPGVSSISVVPVGITKHRAGLCELTPYDRKSSQEVLLQVGTWQKRLLEQHGSRIIYAADEFYILAGLDIPGYEEYEDFPQIENGVGLIASLEYEFYEYLSEIEGGKQPVCGNIKDSAEYGQTHGKRNISIATGVSVFNYIKVMADELAKRYNNLNINVYEIKNCFLGENVTVAGLLTGKDIVSQLEGKELGTELLITESMLKAGEDILLDDYSIGELERKLGVKVITVENNGRDFIEKILGTELKRVIN